MSDTMQPFRVSNDALADAGELRRRLDDEGYLFIRGLQDPVALANLRLEMLAVMREGGWIAAGTDLGLGIADLSSRCAEGDPEYGEVYHQVYKLEAFHRAGHAREVVDLLQRLLGEPVLPHPQKIARLWVPQYTDHTTPGHQDYGHFQGTFDPYPCWTPLSPCPVALGGLALIPRSHKIDVVLPHHFSLGAGSLALDPAGLGGDWFTTDYELGDCLFFHSLTVHQALPNTPPDRLRVSLDNRYSALSQPIAEHMLEPHLARLRPFDWPEVYADWTTTDLQYYWRELDLETRAKDESYGDTGFEDAIQKARTGDPHAQLWLKRLIRRDPTTERALTAQQVVEHQPPTTPSA